jgi:hypothetical protein
MDFAIVKLKAKYRISPNKIRPRLPGEPDGIVTRVYSGGRFKSKTSNAGKAEHAKQGTGHRRRQGLGATA